MCITSVAISYALQRQIDDIRLSVASVHAFGVSLQDRIEQAQRRSHYASELLLTMGDPDLQLQAEKLEADRQCQQLQQALAHYRKIDLLMQTLSELDLPQSLHQVALELQAHIDAIREIEQGLCEGFVGGGRSRLQFPFFAGSCQSSKNVEFDDHMRYSGLPP